MRSRLFIFILLFASARAVSLPGSGTRAGSITLYPQRQPVDSATKKKLVKKLVDSFRFKKNLRSKEEQRVIGIINRLLLKDTLITAQSLRMLSRELQDKEKQHYDTLLLLINALTSNLDLVKEKYNGGLNEEEPPANQTISDKDLDNLVNQLVPILAEKAAEEKSEEERQEKLRRIRALLAKGGSVTDTLVINDTLSKQYSLRLSRQGDVYGFNPHWVKERYQNYNFNLLSTLIFYGYELDWKTGGYVSLHGWDSSTVIEAAQREGCSVTLAVFISNAQNISTFLKNVAAQKQLAKTVAAMLDQRPANGAHLIFENISVEDKDRFVRFVRYFSGIVRAADSSNAISLSVPVIDEPMAYDVKALDPYVDKFVIDFTKKNDRFPGPLAPLDGGGNSLASGLSLYLNKNIAPSKFIACLPYRGATWTKHPEEFIEYVAYNEIKGAFGSTRIAYEHDAVTARMDFVNGTDTIEQLWYDDAKTLAKKYDYLLNNGLGGAGIWALGYDHGYGELWSVLLEKFISVDTFNVQLLHFPGPKETKLSFWGKIKREFHEYRLLLDNPCHKNSSAFKTDDYIIYGVLFFLVVSIIVGFIYVYNIRNKGDSWVWRKAVLRLLIVLVILVIISTFMYFFLNKNIPFIGLSDGNCTPMPFSSLIIILSAGFIFGLLVMRFLIIPLIKREDVP